MLVVDPIHVPRIVAFTDGVNQCCISASSNPTIRITGLIVGHLIMHRFSTVFLATIQFQVQLGSTALLQHYLSRACI